MVGRAIAMGALLLVAAGCGDRGAQGAEGANGAALTNNVAATDAGGGEVQNQIRNMPEGQRNAVLIRAIRDANLSCQHVAEASAAQTSNQVPVYLATCDDGAVYAVAISNDGTARVQPVTPAKGK
jgi:hypothetical protein